LGLKTQIGGSKREGLGHLGGVAVDGADQDMKLHGVQRSL
jgi:hypothetical protein